MSSIHTKVATDRPAIAVLPFANMSGDPEQQYFSDGVTEDIITELSRFRQLSVIARHSSFQYRDKAVDVRRVGRELGVQYVVEGSIRRAGNRLRIAAQLVDTLSGDHLWAERYDRDLTDIFAVQDEVVSSVVAALRGRIADAGAQSARRKRPENLTAYDLLLRGMDCHAKFDRAEDAKARDMFQKAIALDPDLAPAHAWLAVSCLRDWFLDLSVRARDQAFALAKRATELDANDSLCQGVLGYVCIYGKRFDEAAIYCERAIKLNPNEYVGYVDMAWLQAYIGKPADALEWFDRASDLNPLTPMWSLTARGMVLYVAHRYAEAVELLRRDTDPDQWTLTYLVASYGQLGRIEEAAAATIKSRIVSPNMSLLAYATHEPFKHTADLEHLLDGLRKAGLRE